MQQEEVLDFICSDHQEKIISVQLSETGENRMFCLKCFTQKQVSIEEFTKQLKELRIKQTKNLNQQQIQNEKGLERFKKVLITIKDQFNKQIDVIIRTIEDQIINIKQDIQQEIEEINKPIQQLTLSQVDQKIKDLKNIKDNNKYQQQIKQIKIKVIEDYYYLLKLLITQIKQELIENKNEVEINVQSNEDDKENQILEQQQIKKQYQLKQYKLIREEKGIVGGWAMTMNQDETILVNSSCKDIQIWHFSSYGQLNLKQTLKGHTNYVLSLYFSKKSDMFISGSWDETIRVWQKNDQDEWVCTQTLEGHEHRLTDILLDNEDDQLISCGEDQQIKIWMRQKDNDQWKCVQTLIGHNIEVFFISLSPDCNQLASTGYDGLRLWNRGSDKVWKLYQLINNLNKDKFVRIKYINNNELIVQSQYQGRLIRFIKNGQGLYEIQSQLQFNLLKEELIFLFPIIYNQQLGIVLLRHSNKHTYILKKQNNGEFLIHQVLNGNYGSGYITKDGRICILHELDKWQHEIWKNE